MKTLSEYLKESKIDEETVKPEFVKDAKPRPGSVLSLIKPKNGRGMREKIAVWYNKEYSDDPKSKDLNYYVTFADLALGMDLTLDFYDMLETGDSIVRERVFTELSKRLGCKYNDVYDKWLEPKFVKGVFADPVKEFQKLSSRCGLRCRPQKRID